MKAILLLLLSFFVIAPESEANTEACTAHLMATPYKASKSAAFDLCSLNPAFIHQCMEESSATYLTHDFETLSDICLARFQRETKQTIPFTGSISTGR